MRPYGRLKTVKQNPSWKIDYHLRENGKKLLNWWEEICRPVSRKKMKQDFIQNIDLEN